MTSRYDAVRAIMNDGELYQDYGDGLEALDAERVQGKELVHDYNATRPSETEERARLLRELLAEVGDTVWIEPPLRASYGSHTHVGSHVYANFNLVLIDDGDIFIGDRVMFGPNVTITTTGHPIHPDLRDGGTQFSAPVRIGDDVWIGSNVVLLPGVTIGAGSIVAAGAVVSRHVPPMVVVGGVPARVLRPIGPEDRTYAYKPPRSL